MTKALAGRIALVLTVLCVLAGASEALAGGQGRSRRRGDDHDRGRGWQVSTGRHQTPMVYHSWRSAGLRYDSGGMVPFRGHPPVRMIQPIRQHPPVVLYQPVYRGRRPTWRSGHTVGGYSRFGNHQSHGGFGLSGGHGSSISFGNGTISIRIVLD